MTSTTTHSEPPSPKQSLATWRTLLAALGSLAGTGSAMTATGATLEDLSPLLDKGGLIGAGAIFVYLGWSQAIALVGSGIVELRAIRDRIADIGAKQETHAMRLDSVDSRMGSFDRRLEDIQKTLASQGKTQPQGQPQ